MKNLHIIYTHITSNNTPPLLKIFLILGTIMMTLVLVNQILKKINTFLILKDSLKNLIIKVKEVFAKNKLLNTTATGITTLAMLRTYRPAESSIQSQVGYSSNRRKISLLINY